MILDRKLQLEILEALEEVYPDSLLVAALPRFVENREYMGNLFYLQEHGVIEGDDFREPGKCRSMVDVQITKDGLDFLAGDGGLKALLDRSQMRLHREDVTAAITTGIQQAGIDVEKQDKIKADLKALDCEELRLFLLRMVEESCGRGEIISSLFSVT